MNKLQTKLERLKLMLVDDGYNGSNIVYKTLIEIMAEEKNNTEKQLNLSGVSQRIELLKAFLKNADDKGNIVLIESEQKCIEDFSL